MKPLIARIAGLCLIGVIAMAATFASAQEPSVPDGFTLGPLMRTSIMVRDLEVSLKLYRDILGLRPRVERNLEGEAANVILGTRDQTVRLAILQSGDFVFANVGLFEYVKNTAPPPAIVPEVRTGDVVLVFLTSDIFGVHDAVKAAGYTIISPPTVLFPQEGAPVQSAEMIFFDSDGVAINLIQRDVPVDRFRN